MMFITCRYSCPECGLTGVHVEVPARADENVVTWVKETFLPTVRADHARRRPDCEPTMLTDLMIPIMGTGKVGGPVTH